MVGYRRRKRLLRGGGENIKGEKKREKSRGKRIPGGGYRKGTGCFVEEIGKGKGLKGEVKGEVVLKDS